MSRRPLSESLTQKPNGRGICGTVKYEFYWKCLLSTLLVHLCVCYAVWCHVNHYAYAAQLTFTYSHGPCAQGYNFIPIAFGFMLYIIYIMECWHSRLKFTKMKKVCHTEALEYIEKMRCAPPIVWWKSICYHYVRRTRQVTRYRNGDAVTATQAFYERVNSQSSGNIFMFDMCGVKDISKNLIDLEQYPVTKIRFSKGFVFACLEAANEFEEQRARFFNENELRDDYMEVTEGLDFAGMQFVDQMIVFSTRSRKCPWYFSGAAFWILSLILLSWPLRIFCELRTAHANYQITKLFGTNYLSPSSINYTGPIRRTSTIDSRELDLIAQHDNYLIVPSYSEAMLHSSTNADQTRIVNYRSRNRPLTTCNENVISNYGAINRYQHGNESRPNNLRRNIAQRVMTRSRSMSQVLSRYSARIEQTRMSIPSALPRSGNAGPPRSVSIGGISAAWRSSGYDLINEEQIDDQRPLIEPLRPIDEPPPPYEVRHLFPNPISGVYEFQVALKMCAPLYERLRRSANSLTSKLNSISCSSSKELSFKRQRNIEGQGSSKDRDF